MGAIIGKFRKAKTTTEQLERLEEKISEIEKYTINTQEQKKRFVGNFLAISIGVYVIAFIVFYFVYFPPTWNERILYSVPLFLFPIVIYLLRRLLTWYFQRKLNKNSKRLNELRSEKKKILEKVMEKETYKVAVSLLARFGDKSYGTRPSLGMSAVRPSAASNTNQAQSTALQGNSSRQSMNSSFRGAMNTSTSSNTLTLRNTTGLRGSPASSGGATSTAPLTPRLNSQSLNYAPRQLTAGQQGAPQHGQVQVTQELRRRTPFPVLDLQNKGVFDRIVDVLMGDGPQDRFAMICKECYAHNGMALKDDFDFMAFRCAFCNVLNPARKARQVAPLLPKPEVTLSSASITRKANGDDTSSSSDTSSDTSGDENDDVRGGGSNKRLNFTECDDTSALAPRAAAAAAVSASAGESANEELTNLIDAMEIDAEQSNEDFEEEQAYTKLDEDQTQQQEEEELQQQAQQSKAETLSVSAQEFQNNS